MIYVVNNKAQVMPNGKMLDYVQYYPQNWILEVDITCGGSQFSAGIDPFGKYVYGINKVPERDYATRIESYSGTAHEFITAGYYYYNVSAAGQQNSVTYVPNSGHIEYVFYGAYPTAFRTATASSAYNSPYVYPTAFSGKYKLPKALDIYVQVPGNPSTPWVKPKAPHLNINVGDISSAAYFGYDTGGWYHPYYIGTTTAITGEQVSSVQHFHVDINYPEA